MTDITANGALVTVTPEDASLWYHFDTVPLAEFKEHGNAPKSYTEYYLTMLREKNPDVSLADLLKGICFQGVKKQTYTDFQPETEYVAFAVAMTEEGVCPAEGVSKTFTTLAAGSGGKNDCTFDIEVTDITTMSATIRVTPSRDDVWYYGEHCSKEDYLADTGGTDQGVVEWLESVFLFNQESLGMSMEEVVTELMCMTGPSGYTDDYLRPGTDYIVYYCGFDLNGKVITEVSKKEFSTQPVKPSDITFSIEVGTVTASGAIVECEPSNGDWYFIGALPSVEIEGLDDDAATAAIEAFFEREIDKHIGRGPVTMDLEGTLEDDTEYTVVAFGYDAYVRTSDIARDKTFRTLRGGAPEDCTFDVTVDPLRPVTGMVNIRPSDSSVWYYFDISLTADYTTDEAAVAQVLATLQDEAERRGRPIEDIVARRRTRGYTSKQAYLDPETEFTVYVYAMNDDGTAAGEVTQYVFTTPAITRGTATCSVDVDKYYDGDALYAYDPEYYDGVQGFAFIPVDVVHSADAVHWYVGFYGDELTDPEYMPDDELIVDLVYYGGGLVDRTHIDYVGDWGIGTFICIAEDAEGSCGPVFRKYFPVSQEGASPIDDFVKGTSRPYAAPWNRGTIFGNAPARRIGFSESETVYMPDLTSVTAPKTDPKAAFPQFSGGGFHREDASRPASGASLPQHRHVRPAARR